MVRFSTRMYSERGSALVEFSLLAGVLLPLGLGMSMLGKLTDLNQTTEQASRYTAWEATVYSRQQLAALPSAQVETRFFKAPDALISSKTQSGNAEQAENPLWGVSAARQGSLRELASVSRQSRRLVSSRYAFDTGKATKAQITGKIAAAAGRPLSGFSGNSWGIVADGLLRSRVDVAVKSTGLLKGMPGSCGTATASTTEPASASSQDGSDKHVCVRSSGVILADGWAASGDAQAVSRVRSLVPGSTLQKIGKGVGKLLGSVVFPELDPLDKAFGHVDMGVLPKYAQP